MTHRFRARSATATSAICSRISSASTPARRSGSSCATACSAARRSASTAPRTATIQFFAQYNIIKNQKNFPVGLSAGGSIDGTNNFRDSYSPGARRGDLARARRARRAVRCSRMWVNNSNPDPRSWSTTTTRCCSAWARGCASAATGICTSKLAPRSPATTPGDALMSFGVEKRVGGHVFQLEFLEQLRDHDGADRARRQQQRRLVYRLQHRQEILLMSQSDGRVHAAGSAMAYDGVDVRW